MTECNPPKIRSIIEKHLGKAKAEEYDTIVEQCKLGQALKDDRVWAPLCPSYHNLKGVTCKEIDEFVDEDKFKEEYFRHVKVYDRDEEYTAFKKIGEQIESDSPGILHNLSTIFVTTPRGGHEMLSIFAYANDISKEQIPSDISWSHLEQGGYSSMREPEYRKDPHKKAFDDNAVYNTEIYGKTWVTDETSGEIKNIFIVDDIVASGHQVVSTSGFLNQYFPNATINSITLCKRENIPEEGTPECSYEHSGELSDPCRRIEKYYTDTETIGINAFTEQRTEGKIDKEYITCLFPHACPDGSSDKLMVELMGDKRCSPEKRISKRNL